MMRSPRSPRRKEEGHLTESSLKEQLEVFAKVSESSLKEQLNIFARGTLQRELEQLKASILAELAENKVEQVTKEALHHELERFKSSIVTQLNSSGRGRRDSGFERMTSGASQASELSLKSERSNIHDGNISKAPRVPPTVLENDDSDIVREVSPADKAGEQPLLDAPATQEQLDEQQGFSSPHTRTLASIVLSDTFDTIAAGVVLLSVIWLTFQTQYNALYWCVESQPGFVCIEALFCVLFGTELALRIVGLGCEEFFCGSQMIANAFDFVLVAFQVADTSVTLVGLEDKKSPLSSFVRILRLFRIFRLVRIFRFFPDLRMLVVSAFQAFQPLMWVFILIFFITGVFALTITSIVNEYKTQFTFEEFKDKEEEFADDLVRLTLYRSLQDFFGSVDKSTLTLYGCISGGRDWHASALPLVEFIHPQLILVFLFYTFFMIFAMMNIVTSQFVDTALEASANDRRESMVGSLMQTFSKASGFVTEEDFMRHLDDTNMKNFLKDLYKREDVTATEIKDSRLFEMLDDDGSGAITKDELVLGCIKLTGSATSLDLAVMKMDVNEIRKDIEAILAAVRRDNPMPPRAQGA